MTTAIEWTDTTWNPTTGCDRVSPGCDHCYALTMAKRLKGMGQAKYQRDGDPRTSGPGFGITEHPSVLDEPLRWRKPRRVFVNSMSDLFHQGVSDDFIARVWAAMAVTRRHTFQVLTKRHGRMRTLLSQAAFRDAVEEHVSDLMGDTPTEFSWRIEVSPQLGWTSRTTTGGRAWAPPWPLPNVWLGVSVEDQKRANLRIPALLDTPAAVRFLSCEPLLGEVDISDWACVHCRRRRWVNDENWQPEDYQRADDREPGAGRIPCGGCNPGGWHEDDIDRPGLNWVIVGGESGPGARPMHPDWARSLRDQCSAAGVPFFFKQWGDWAGIEDSGHPIFDYVTDDDRCQIVDMAGQLRGRPWPGWAVQDGTRDAAAIRRYGKHAAGRELDGRTWDEYPAGSR